MRKSIRMMITNKDFLRAYHIAHHLGNITQQSVGSIAVVWYVGKRPGQCSPVDDVQGHEEYCGYQNALIS